MKSPFKYFYFLLAAALLAGCSDDNNGSETPVPDEKDKYVLMTTTQRFQEGYFASFSGFPSGSVKSTNDKALGLKAAFGFRTFGKWIFHRFNSAGDEGLQKVTVNADGSFKDEGFIAGASQFLVLSETSGYYLDLTRGSLKLQKFNPTTMLRTGEIDLSSLKKAGVEFQSVGQHTLAAKEGKLYAGITYGTTAGEGYGDDLYNTIEMAVIDIATDKYEKTIKYDGLRSLGWGSSGNKMWSVGDDGALYLYATGLGKMQFEKSSILRIKKGETDFDRNWILTAPNGNSIVTALIKGGKLYYELASTPLKPDYTNLTASIFDYYVYDFTTKQSTKITGMPLHDYAYANEQAITEIDGKIYLWVRNGTVTTTSGSPVTTVNEDGYYVLNGTSATSAFKVAHDGTIQGFAKMGQ